MKKLLAVLFLGSGLMLQAQVPAQQSSQPISLPPTPSTALEASHVLLPGPGQLFSLTVTDTAAEYILVINSPTVPANGPVSLLYPPIKVAANTTTMIVFPIGLYASQGISVCNSSTGTFTKTIGGSTCIFTGQVQ